MTENVNNQDEINQNKCKAQHLLEHFKKINILERQYEERYRIGYIYGGLQSGYYFD